MNDDWQPGFTGGDKMLAKTGFLLFAVAIIIIIIKTGFSDPDNLCMARTRDQFFCRHVTMMIGFVRMDANRRPYVILALCKPNHRVPFIFTGRYVEHGCNTGSSRPRQNISLLLDQALVI